MHTLTIDDLANVDLTDLVQRIFSASCTDTKVCIFFRNPADWDRYASGFSSLPSDLDATDLPRQLSPHSEAAIVEGILRQHHLSFSVRYEPRGQSVIFRFQEVYA